LRKKRNCSCWLAAFYSRLPVVGGCSGETGGGTKLVGSIGALAERSVNACCPGQGVTAEMQSRSIGAAANAAFMIPLSAAGSAAIAD
jgi:hypothetical protein